MTAERVTDSGMDVGHEPDPKRTLGSLRVLSAVALSGSSHRVSRFEQGVTP